MTQLRLVSDRTVPQPGLARNRPTHPCLEAFRQEFDYLVRSLRRLGVPSQDVEDLAHEVFLVLYRTWEKYDPERPLRAYLFGIAFRVAAAHTRKTRRECLRAVTDASDLGPLPDQTLESKQARALVLRALDQVPLQRRAVLVMHDIDALPMSAIAAALSIYRFTGYSRLRKARREFAMAVLSLRGDHEP